MSRIAIALIIFSGSWATGSMASRGLWSDAGALALLVFALMCERGAWQKATGRAEARFVEGSDEG